MSIEKLEEEVRELRRELQELRTQNHNAEVERLKKALRQCKIAAADNSVHDRTCCLNVISIVNAVL